MDDDPFSLAYLFIKVDFLEAGSTFVAEIDCERNPKTPPQQRDFHYFHEAQNL